MNKQIEDILKKIKSDEISVEDGVSVLTDCFFSDLGFAKVDHHRARRCGFPEVVFCQSKTPKQVAAICKEIFEVNKSVLATKANQEHYEAVREVLPLANFSSDCGIIIVCKKKIVKKGLVSVISAGTSDIPVAEEAALTSEISGSNVDRIFDVGVAGVHRVLSFKDQIQKAKAVVCVAGMEGALPTIIAGLVSVPVIAVPTSVGYGASFKGIAPLLAMMNSCATGVSVVNIDNGFGAGYIASMINRNSG